MQAKQDNRRYDLYYRGVILLTSVQYCVANGKKGELSKSPNWGKIIAAKFGVSESKVNDITSKALNEFKNQKSKI